MSNTPNQAQNANEKLALIASILNAATPNNSGSLDRFNNLVETDYKEFTNQ